MTHVLIAEDERIERMALAKTLSGYLGDEGVIHQAENGRQAVSLFRQYPVQAAILDIEMPVMNGIETAQTIFSENPGCSIIFLTAFDRFDYARKAISVRAQDYLLKPYADKELLAAVDTALYHAQSHAQTTVDPEPSDAAEPRADRAAAIASLMEDYVRDHYRQEISMQDAARALNYSDPYFCKIFKQQFGQNFTSYLTEYRIRHAKELLCRPTVNIKEIGLYVGYPDANYFAKVFRRMTGQSPSEYRLTHLEL